MPGNFQMPAPAPVGQARIWRGFLLFAALLLLNAMLTFHNVWPTLLNPASMLSLSERSDVMVVFLESYGRVAYDRPEFFQTLTSARAELNAAVRETGRGIVSGYVESPTFGGGSWFALEFSIVLTLRG